jgi:hypothetical protein
MKTKIILFLLFCNVGFSQSGEFMVYPNGLIYSEQSVTKLKHIVDSLNLKFRVCEFNKVFKSVSQTKANYISLEKTKVVEAKKDMDNNISFEEFLKKHPKSKISKNRLVIKSSYFDDYDNKNIIRVSAVEYTDRDRFDISKEEDEVKNFFQTSVKGKWFYEYHEKTEYSDESIEAFYFIDDFSSKPMNSKYSRLIQYADCMVDTTSQVFYERSKESGNRFYDTIPRKYQKFVGYIDEVLKKPKFSNENFEILMGMDTINFEKPNKKLKISKKDKEKNDERRKLIEEQFISFQNKNQIWEDKRIARLDSLKINDSNFMPMLITAYEESKITMSSDDEFEEYVGRYISKDAELEMKRNRRVIGGCSMDQSPRIHAFNIALLSAETTKWEIFLRSHLNIMNDRFDRVSDGSYAQEGRKTYIKELEVLDIDVLDLIIGISLRVENPSSNHYYGSINRIGRALSESKYKIEIETILLDMIKDDELDDYNRVLIYFLFDNYNYSIGDENVKAENKIKLKEAVSKLPEYISSKIQTEN